MISDHPLAASGVGLATKYIIDHLVKTGKFNILSLGGAMYHKDYNPQKVQEWGDNVIILPINGYGDKVLMRRILDIEKPDAIWFITDPRYYTWLWQMEDEIHKQCPLIYWHVWDNLPYPKYNEVYYNSTDFIGCINKLTYNFLKDNNYKNIDYIPHGVPETDYKILSKEEVLNVRKNYLQDNDNKKFIVFYNSRNALRKRTGNVVWAFKIFLDKLSEEERENAYLCMQTPVKDPEGQDLFKLVEYFGIEKNVGFNEKKVDNSVMNEFYNMADVTISLSSEEGFGLSILESLMAGTPVICTKTGGMQDQVIDEEAGREFGFCLKPDATSLIGSQPTPYIESHHVDPHTAADAIMKLYQEKKSLGDKYKEKWAGEESRKSCMKRFNLKEVQEKWEKHILETIESYKSKKSSENKNIRFLEI